jgi:hypothetical protein
MPNHDVPIEQADVWDILDWDTVAALSIGAPTTPTAATGLSWMAARLIEAATKTIGREDELFLKRLVSGWVPYKYGGKDDAIRRQAAAALAEKLGAGQTG